MAAGQYGPRDGPMGGGGRMKNKPMHNSQAMRPNQNFGGPAPSTNQGFGVPPAVGRGGDSTSNGFGAAGLVPRPGISPQLELKLIFNRDEIAYLFGFDGVLVGQLCQQTGAKIHVTSGESFDYVCSISGTLEIIFKAFSLVCRKLWDFWTTVVNPGQQRPMSIKLAVPGPQCGSIIGKQGAKIKEIRDLTGASIQVKRGNFILHSEGLNTELWNTKRIGIPNKYQTHWNTERFEVRISNDPNHSTEGWQMVLA